MTLRTIKIEKLVPAALFLYTFYFLTAYYNETLRFTNLNINVVLIFFVILLLLFSKMLAAKKIDKIKTYVTIWLPFTIVLFINWILYFVGEIYFLQFLTALIIIFFLPSDLKSCRKCILLIKYFAFFYCIGCLIQFFLPSLYNLIINIFLRDRYIAEINELKDKYNLYSGFTHQVSHTAFYILYGFGIFVFFYEKKRKIPQSIIIVIITLFTAMILGKRAHLLFSAISIIFVYFISASPNQRNKRMLNIFVIVVVGILALIFLYPILRKFPVMQKIYEIFIPTGPSVDITSGRIPLYVKAFNLFLESPVWGIGWGNYQKVTNSYTIVHSVYLQLLCETGIIGLATFCIPVIYNLWLGIKNIKKIRCCKLDYTENMTPYVKYSLFLQIFFILYCFTGNPFYSYDCLAGYFIAIYLNIIANKHISQYMRRR